MKLHHIYGDFTENYYYNILKSIQIFEKYSERSKSRIQAKTIPQPSKKYFIIFGKQILNV